jgi:hypothetical protein
MEKRHKKPRRGDSCWGVGLVGTRAHRREFIEHAKEFAVLHVLRMIVPLDGLKIGDEVILKKTLAELGKLLDISNRNTLIGILDWLQEHGGLEAYHYTSDLLPKN